MSAQPPPLRLLTEWGGVVSEAVNEGGCGAERDPFEGVELESFVEVLRATLPGMFLSPWITLRFRHKKIYLYVTDTLYLLPVGLVGAAAWSGVGSYFWPRSPGSYPSLPPSRSDAASCATSARKRAITTDHSGACHGTDRIASFRAWEIRFVGSGKFRGRSGPASALPVRGDDERDHRRPRLVPLRMHCYAPAADAGSPLRFSIFRPHPLGSTPPVGEEGSVPDEGSRPATPDRGLPGKGIIRCIAGPGSARKNGRTHGRNASSFSGPRASR